MTPWGRAPPRAAMAMFMSHVATARACEREWRRPFHSVGALRHSSSFSFFWKGQFSHADSRRCLPGRLWPAHGMRTGETRATKYDYNRPPCVEYKTGSERGGPKEEDGA